MPNGWELILRLGLAGVLAGAIGAEREVSDQPAGFRTHALVGLGAALFTILSAYGFRSVMEVEAGPGVREDVTRIASQIVVGIGFLGGGAILKYGASIRGLTTAATLWTTAAIGMAIGLGGFMLGVASTAIGLGILWGLRPVRRLLQRHARTSGTLDVQMRSDEGLASVIDTIQAAGGSIQQIALSEGEDQTDGCSTKVKLRLPQDVEGGDIVGAIAKVDQVRSAEWTP
jgi:putative Mg2+ transporter-C (MgtC) family protein